MTSTTQNASQRSVRHRGAKFFATLGAIAALTLGGVIASPNAAAAADFAITTPDGTLFTSGTVTLTGTKAADGRVEVPSLTGGDPYCIIADAAETWTCTFTLADGASTIVAKQFGADVSIAALETSISVRVLGAPTIDGVDPLLTTGIISGSGLAGAGILVSGTGPEGFSTQCTTVQVGGYWSCPLPVATSGEYAVTVQQLWEGTGEPGGSASRTVIVDKVAPPVPVITRPTAGTRIESQPTTYSGTGETGARVDVFVDSVLVCSNPVTGGTWSCSAGGVASGDRLVQAIQWDAAGNPSGASQGVRVTFGAASGGSTPGGGGTPPTTPSEPGVPEQPAPAPPAPAPSPSETPSPTPAPTLPFFPPPIGGDSGLPPGDTWGTPTEWGAAIPVIWSSPWLLAALLALAFVLLLALPLRLAFATLRGRIEPRLARFAGRNRAPDPDTSPLFSPWTIAAIALAAAILLAALAGGIQGEVRYLRLIVALGIALVVLNGVGVAVAARVSSGAVGARAGIRIVPAFLAVAALTALFSRGGGVQPPVIVGVVIAATFAAEIGTRSRGIVSLAQLATLTLLGLWAWLGHSALGPQEGLGLSLASETLAGLCIAAFGSLLLVLLPVWRMPGRYLFDWSWPVWLVVTLVAGTLAAAVIATSETFPLPWVLGIALLFAAASVSAWAWIRWVEPQLIARDA